jgi:Fe-Mn family superoxide dismutase
MMTRREALKVTLLATAGTVAFSPAIAGAQTSGPAGPFSLPALPYAFDALEPHIDARTMEIHHDKHHAAYVANLNKAVADTELAKRPIESLVRELSKVPENIRTTVRNNGGGHYNHSLFWQMMKKGEAAIPVANWPRRSTKRLVATTASRSSFLRLRRKCLAADGHGW